MGYVAGNIECCIHRGYVATIAEEMHALPQSFPLDQRRQGGIAPFDAMTGKDEC